VSFLHHELDSLSDTDKVRWFCRTPCQPGYAMIQLTRLNHQELVLNADLVKWIEQAPDTVITLVTGEKMIVRETGKEVVARIMRYRCSLMRAAWGSAVMPLFCGDPGILWPPRPEK
jgi:flagellar protein FlbD